MKKIIAIILVLGSVGACKSKQASGDILPLDSMKLVMWDMMRADEMAVNESIRDTGINKRAHNIPLYKEVLTIHHLTKEQFYNNYHYYLAHPDLNKILIDSLTSFAERKRNQQYGPKTPAL